jgi:integrase
MPQAHLTNRSLSTIVAPGKPYFIRDTALRGLGVKVTSKGQIKFVVEVWHGKSSTRKTIGEFPFMPVQVAREQALSVISDIKAGLHQKKSKATTLEELFNQYVSTGRLKQRTIADYKEAIFFYLHDWLDKPVDTITKKMVEQRFYRIKDKGMQGGKPTHSQAAKTMRIFSALMNYARGDELIEKNPVEILKLKKVDRSIPRKTSYLKNADVQSLLSATKEDSHPGTLAVLLMLYSGLRKNEALSIKWCDIKDVEGLSVIYINETKNSETHYIPVTPTIQNILDRATNETKYVFPSPQKNDAHICDLRDCIKRLEADSVTSFSPHDLRRTFATRAFEVGIDYLMIKRLLNHKTNDITARYIQWDSRQNLEAMREALEQVTWQSGSVTSGGLLA